MNLKVLPLRGDGLGTEVTGEGVCFLDTGAAVVRIDAAENRLILLEDLLSAEVFDQHDIGFVAVYLIVEQPAAVGRKTQSHTRSGKRLIQHRDLAALARLQAQQFQDCLMLRLSGLNEI